MASIKVRPKITSYETQNLTVEDMAKKHYEKLSYGEELQRQVELKKQKDKMLKQKIDEEDMQRERQIK
eukprot:CAMPEP_0170511940 /NCGR_PEP_ID=MMETSP0208-20121228/66575_1 /TAXON_ID=197538 /ORGANISM="Strombidium inclinatum, Strain S3" /LENGTH=67 /DNA_ID=CAMNT_0010795519 /DNA_START=1060 /DNA_END=1263 /DNA_ORIENTATION=-